MTITTSSGLSVEIDESTGDVLVRNTGRQNPVMIAQLRISTSGVVNRLTVTAEDSLWKPGEFGGQGGFSVQRTEG